MTKLVTKKFSNHISQQVVESITESSNNVYFVFASKHTPYSSGDDNVPSPKDSTEETFVQPYQEIMFGKKITSSDVSLMIPRYNWVANTVYSKYDNTDGNLFSKTFYAVSNTGAFYNVYKCLNNNNGGRSTQEPTDVLESACSFVTTSDGYQWKLMYRLTSAEFNKFATSNYLPVKTSANVSGNAVSGAIDTVFVLNTGSNYIGTLSGQFRADDIRDTIPNFSGNTLTYRLSANAASNNGFYVASAIYLNGGTGSGQIRRIENYTSNNRVIVIDTPFDTSPASDTTYIIAPMVSIQGDGSGAKAYANISTNSSVSGYVSDIVIVNRGTNYTYATAQISGNTGGVSNSAVLQASIGPKGGHGSDAPNELGASLVGISVNFANNENGFISTENDFRTIGILKDPLFNNVTLTMTDEQDTFDPGEVVYQHDFYNLVGEINVTASSNNVTGFSTSFTPSLKSGDKVIIYDPVNLVQSLREIVSVANSTLLSLNTAPSFSSSDARIALAVLTARGIKSGNSSPYITLSNAEPKFVTGKRIIGESSGAWANVSGISVNEKNYNSWLTFDNRTRIGYSSNTGIMPEDAKIYQDTIVTANADFHSSNGTFLFFTSEKGIFNPDPTDEIFQFGGNSSFTPTSIKYTPDIVKGSGEVLYIENKTPISRSNSSTETVKLILDF